MLNLNTEKEIIDVVSYYLNGGELEVADLYGSHDSDIKIRGNNNRVCQNINNSQINITQSHSGSGDNIAGDKTKQLACTWKDSKDPIWDFTRYVYRKKNKIDCAYKYEYRNEKREKCITEKYYESDKEFKKDYPEITSYMMCDNFK